jgi:hypothetical protein
MPVLEGSDTPSCTAFDASGSENAVVRSIERAGAPAKTVNGAIGVATTGATFCAEAVTEIAKQWEIASASFLVIGRFG